MKRPATIATLFALTLHCSAQTVQVKQILATAWQDGRVVAHRQFTESAKNLATHDGFFRTVEARVGINGSALGDTIYGYIRNEDSYGLILSYNSFRERRHQTSVVQAEQETMRSGGGIYLSNALYERYEDILETYYTQKQQNQLVERQKLLTERQRILRTLAENGQEIKPKEVIETERDKLRQTQQINETTQLLGAKQKTLGAYLSLQAVTLDTSGFISLRQMLEHVNSLGPDPASRQHPELQLLQSKIELERNKIAYVHSQNRQVLQSVRLGYDRPLYLTRPNRFNTQNNLSIRLGLAVPLPGNNRFRKSLALIDQMNAELNLAEKTAEIGDKTQKLRTEMLSWAEILERNEAEAQQSLIPVYLKDPTLRSALSPLEINELELIKLESQEILLEAEFQVAKRYLEYLSESGLIGAFPDKNWLGRE